MKRELYSLTDEPFFLFANRIGEILRKEEIKHNIVGGTAVQSYLLDMLCKKYGTNVSGLFGNKELRLQDYLRSTDDIDLALNLEGLDDINKIRKVNNFVEQLPFEEISLDEQKIIEVKEGRYGASRPTFRVYQNDRGSDEEIIAMNISRGQKGDMRELEDKWYNIFIENSQQLSIPYANNFSLLINVPRLEHLLAAKIGKIRPKDLMDIANLSHLIKDTKSPLDLSEIKNILLPSYEDNYNDFLKYNYSS